jgi:hypothetical protein
MMGWDGMGWDGMIWIHRSYNKQGATAVRVALCARCVPDTATEAASTQ